MKDKRKRKDSEHGVEGGGGRGREESRLGGRQTELEREQERGVRKREGEKERLAEAYGGRKGAGRETCVVVESLCERIIQPASVANIA